MNMIPIFGENQEQGEYWSNLSGPKWIEEEGSMNERFNNLTNEFFKFANLQKGHSVLDVGCGAGKTCEISSKHVGIKGSVLGVDISTSMLKYAVKKFKKISNLSFLNADIQSFNFEERLFDKIISRFGVMFFEDPKKAFKNLHGCLKKNGQINFVCWAPLSNNDFFHLPMKIALKELNLPWPEINKDPGPFSLSELGHLRDILISSNFKKIKIETRDIKMENTDSIHTNAMLFFKIGPASRLIYDHKPTQVVKNLIYHKLCKELKNRRSKGVITINGLVHFVKAHHA